VFFHFKFFIEWIKLMVDEASLFREIDAAILEFTEIDYDQSACGHAKRRLISRNCGAILTRLILNRCRAQP